MTVTINTPIPQPFVLLPPPPPPPVPTDPHRELRRFYADNYDPDFTYLCMRMIAAAECYPSLQNTVFLDDLLAELTDPAYDRRWHYSRLNMKRGCRGPLCLHLKSERIREAIRYRELAKGNKVYRPIGVRRLLKKDELAARTRAAVAYMVWKNTKVTTTLIASCVIDGVPIPKTEHFRQALARFNANNMQKCLQGGLKPIQFQ